MAIILQQPDVGSSLSLEATVLPKSGPGSNLPLEAIVLPKSSPGSSLSLEAIVLSQSRPAFPIKDGTFRVDGDPHWASLESHRPILERAIRCVGRLERDGGLSSYVGTAFLFDRRFAVTANFVAEALAHRPADPAAGAPGALQGVWLNFRAESNAEETERIAVRNIHFVHPYWGFSFLELANEIDPEKASPLPVATAPPESLEGRTVCVIGYPARDVREVPKLMRALFQDTFDVKRLMPGTIMGTSRFGSENAFVLTHDATTTGGTSGAPLIDLATGTVIGIHVGGQHGVANYAVPAWEIGRDPQWARISKAAASDLVPDVAVTRRHVIGAALDEEPIFSYDEIGELHKMFVKIGVTREDKINVLLVGLPNEYLATLPNDGNPADRLSLILHAVNETGGVIRGHSAFYYMLNNSRGMRSWDEAWVKEVQVMLDDLREREKRQA